MMIIKYNTVQDKNFDSDTFANIDTTTRTNSLKVFYDIVKHVEYDVYEDIQETIKHLFHYTASQKTTSKTQF